MMVVIMIMAAVASYAITQTPQRPQRKLSVRKTRDAAPQRDANADTNADRPDTLAIKAQPKLENEDSIPDSLLHPRWKIQRTLPITLDDLDQSAADLKRPDNLKQDVVYNDSLDRYIIGSKISDSYINAPFMMTQEEYRKWSERRMMNQFFRKKNDEIYQAKGKEKFDFTDMHFDLGPAEKIFGPGGVRIKTQGTAELKFGATMKSIDNPSLPVRNRKTTTMDFDEKINVSLNGRVGDKVNMNLNYNTDATFDFDAQSLKLKYDGKEDEIVKLIEAGNVSFPSNSSLVRGASSLFGLRTDLQFGKLKLQLVASQKKSSSKSVSSKGGKQFTPFEIDAANYEENRHFFLAQYFHDRYDESMRSLPNLTSGITINRVEVWVTNKSGVTSNTRNIIALTDLGENNRADNLKQDVVYNDSLDRYIIGSKISDSYINAPFMMTQEEYRKWSERRMMNQFFRKKNDEIYQAKGKEKFDFTDMHFDLGPAEKIFGPGGVRIKTQGTAELKFGATMKSIDNPSLPVRNRKTTTMDFDEKINVSLNGRVGDKVNMNLNYNTDATFDFDAQSLKLKYDGKEDEIVKLIEAGNVSFPSNSSLVRGASSLFGLRTDLQFGKLKLQLVASQKKSSSKSVSSKGGKQFTPFEIDAANYEENRHFFLAQYFHDRYDESMRSLPNLTSGITINRVEVWVTNKSGVTSNTRNIIALTDLGENNRVSNNLWGITGQPVPANAANSEYAAMTSQYAAARDIDQTSTVLDGISGFVGGSDYEKLERARLLNSSEYTVNKALGYISLKTSLQTDQVLAVAYEYTYGGVTYQVGEFASDITDSNKALYVKALKNTSNNPHQGNWGLMMKNVYYLASSVEKEKFRLDVKFQSDTAGVYLTYIPEPQVKNQTLIKFLGADRLDNNNKAHPNGYFDYVEGYTVTNGRVFFPVAEPFGSYMYETLLKNGVAADKAAKYAFTELYDSTKIVAKQIAEKDKYVLMGQFRGTSANVISLGAYNIPQGSVVVTAGGVTLAEGTDYSVDYSGGEVTILNQSIIDAGTAVNVSLESNTDYGQERKTMFGMNWEYDFSKDFQLSGTFQHLSEQALTNKVNMGSEPLNNTIWGLNINWKKQSQWLTNMLDKLPFLHLTQPSSISFSGEFAQLIAGQSSGTQDNASYIDDFENTKNTIDVSTPTSWIISSVPSMFPESGDKSTLRSGFNRSRLAWYTIDPLFTRRSSSLTPSHIKSDLDQLSNHYVREFYVSELFPARDQSAYNGNSSMLNILNLAYYPNERGPYNFDPDLNYDGTLNNPQKRWGGMMRKLDTNDFEAANIEYIEFWMLDPFIYTREQGVAADYGGDFYINLGEMSEDILRDGKKFYESGMPVDGSQNFTTTQWGKVPNQATVVYAFATSKGSRALQDVGFNGLNDEEEQKWESYQDFLREVQGKVNPAVWDSIWADPAGDNYHYFRGSDYDKMKAPILRRYKYINNPQGNSPDNDSRTESYDTSYKSTPDVEDINQDYTLNEYEKFFQYRVSIRPEDLEVGKNYIVDKREDTHQLRNNKTETVNWYQFRIPLREYEKKFGAINDFTSMRFMRMFLTGFKHPIVLRFGTLDLVRGEWRVYEQNLDNSASTSGKLVVSAVNIEENNDKQPVLLHSFSRSSFTQTSPLFTSPELLRTPMTIVFPSPSVGLPITEMRFLGWSGSYAE